MATPYGFNSPYEDVAQLGGYAYGAAPAMFNPGSWAASRDEYGAPQMDYGRGAYGLPQHGQFNPLDRYPSYGQDSLHMQHRMQGMQSFDAPMRRPQQPRGMGAQMGGMGRSMAAPYPDFDMTGANYFQVDAAKLEPVDTLHVSTPHDRSMDRADLCDIFFPMQGMKKISFHENYVFVLFEGVSAARNAMIALQQGQAGVKGAQLTVTFARQSYRDNYYHPDEVYLASKRLHLTHFPKNTHARELERIFNRYRGFERLEHNIKWAYVDFMHETYAKEAMEDLNNHTNLIVSYAKPGAGEVKSPQRMHSDMLWAMQMAARQRNYPGFAGEDKPRLSPRALHPLDDLRGSPGAMMELGQLLQTMQLADVVKRQGSPGSASFDLAGPRPRPAQVSTSPTLLASDRRSSAPLLTGDFDETNEYLLGAFESRQSAGSERSTSPFSLREMSAIVQNANTTPVSKHGAIRRPVPSNEGDALKDSWSNLPTPVTSEPQSPQQPLEQSNSSGSTETLVFPDSASPYSSPTLSSVSDELKERKRNKEQASERDWSFFNHGPVKPPSVAGVSDSEDDGDSEKTSAASA